MPKENFLYLIFNEAFWALFAFPLFLFLFKRIISSYFFNAINNRKMVLSKINERIKNNLQEIKNYQNKINFELYSYNEKIENYIALNLQKEVNNWEEILKNEKDNIDYNLYNSIELDSSLNMNDVCAILYERLKNE